MREWEIARGHMSGPGLQLRIKSRNDRNSIDYSCPQNIAVHRVLLLLLMVQRIRARRVLRYDEPSAHAPCTRITSEALVTQILPFLPPTIETTPRRGVPFERHRGGRPVPID